MKKGDRVELKSPFQPTLGITKVYNFGIIASVVAEGSSKGVLLYLYDPEHDVCFTDEFNTHALYWFPREELDSVVRGMGFCCQGCL